MSNLLKPPVILKLSRKNRRRDIAVIGDRDQRGYDNLITVWLDKDDRLHIKVMKPDLCYRFKEVVETDGYIEVIQE